MARLVLSLQDPKQFIPHPYSSQQKVRKGTDSAFSSSRWLELNHIATTLNKNSWVALHTQNIYYDEGKEKHMWGHNYLSLIPTYQTFLTDADSCVLYLYNVLVWFFRRIIFQLEWFLNSYVSSVLKMELRILISYISYVLEIELRGSI